MVMFASHNDSFICYELFTSRAEMRKNDALGELIIREKKIEQQRSRMSWPADLTFQLTLTYPTAMPLNVKCHTHGVAPDPSVTSSMAVIDYFGVLEEPAASAIPAQGFYQRFNDPSVARIAEFLVKHRPFFNARDLRELARTPTALELSRDRTERLVDYFINLVVPFKQCIENIASGEQDRVTDGIYGCLIDGISLVGTVAGFHAKAISISAKAMSTMAKAARFTKLVFSTAFSLFNPLDGVPSGLMAGGKLVRKGLLSFSTSASEVLVKANKQLHKLSGGRKTLDLFDSAGHAQAGLGNWRPRGSVADVAVLAGRRGNKWYALNRRGNVWGKPLDGFSYKAPLNLPQPAKTLPQSYTRQFIEQSLPHAQGKVDNAINALKTADINRDCSAVMKSFFGDASALTSNQLLDCLAVVNFEFPDFSLNNILLDSFKETSTIAELDVNNYARWKAARASDGKDIAFIEFHTKNLNKHFVSLGFNHDVVADDLLHEFFRASAQTDDVSFATEAASGSENAQRLDVAPLLNIAAGCMPVSEESTVCHAPSRAFANADSLAVATSLLSQLRTDKATYDRNITIIVAALKASGGEPIVEPVLITLNKQA
ncbi:hypothetical protein [Pseudomonas sp. SWRI99]|uniref:hypothetical protein n=1 Tax=Pseudomonas sp. SWRI99 TaxID=2745506 RepID=UPI001646AEEB|nr:hypothetical protein [Pseudomonas sp. SWRI99]MBC3775527.1 hypothetical protein [Pseudomonas sp. SWRI99]